MVVGLGQDVAEEHPGLVLLRAKRYDEAEADYKALTSGQFSALYVVPYGEFLQRRGRIAEARTLYADTVQRDPSQREMRRALAAIDGKKPPAPPLLSLRQGAAQALRAAAQGFSRVRPLA